MNPDDKELSREEVMMGVLYGDLDESNLTEEEIWELCERVNDIITERVLAEAQTQGKTVFSERDNGMLN